MDEYECTWVERKCSKRKDNNCTHLATRDNCEKRRRDLARLYHNYLKAKDLFESDTSIAALKEELRKARNELTLFLQHYNIEFSEDRFHPLYGE